MRFRHKLSIVLIGLALVPLVAAGVLVPRLLEHDQVTRVDNGLAVSAAGRGAGVPAPVSNAAAPSRARSPANRKVQSARVQPTKQLATGLKHPPRR